MYTHYCRAPQHEATNLASHLVLCLYVCISVTLRNANFLYAACTRGRTIVVSRPQGTISRVCRIDLHDG